MEIRDNTLARSGRGIGAGRLSRLVPGNCVSACDLARSRQYQARESIFVLSQNVREQRTKIHTFGGGLSIHHSSEIEDLRQLELGY
ncbi:hypothetical protein EVAR_47098_1 [Eumeta japonica]|uniref:Uncharacterized protein n=1 Tax=Eumeta variegata TaxID=151549 RepID=A0A4C1YBV4_EUMVA|nr:hypothetical protein EVAR_47098_1 [Eumeta japonica]